ncbi:MAG TPA: glycosyltransferase family 1 protein [Patescibacteria group bacterium]|nr:glycosyltransferase family 1 protein [Patescibacteria group bacterium]
MAKIVIDARELRTSTGRYVERMLLYLQQIDTKNNYFVLLKPADMDGWKPSSNNFKKVSCRYKEFSLGEQLGMWKQIHDLNADLVHFVMVQQPIGYQGKVVTTMQDLTTARFRNTAKNWLVFTIKQQVYKFVIYWTAHKSAVVITPTQFVKEDVARYASINSRKITVTLEAADEITEKPEPIEELEDKDFIMYVGRPQPHKNLEMLVDAFALLRQTNPSLRLVLAGKKDVLYRRLEKYVQQKGLKNVIFTDFVSEGQLRWLYEHTGVYVFPSLSEGFGLPGLEAMVHGAPVASSDTTSLPEVYKDAAVYFDPTNVEEMASSIGNVLRDERLRKHLIARGKAVSGSYSWRRMAAQTLEVYKEVLET